MIVRISVVIIVREIMICMAYNGFELIERIEKSVKD